MFSHRIQALLLSFLLGSTPVFAQTLTQEDAFAAGKAAGDATKREAIKAGINDTAAGNLIPGYSSTPPAQSGYWAGNKTLVAPAVAGGQTLQTDCLNTLPTDPVEKARCEAIRAVVGSNAAAPAYSGLVKKTDAIYLSGKAVGNDPESIAGSINGTYTACTTATLTTPGDMILETCDEAMTNATLDCVMGQEVTVDPDHLYKCTETMSVINTGQCTVGTVVQVDADANYQCEKTEKAYQTFNCDRTANVTVTPTTTISGGCVPGVLLTSVPAATTTFAMNMSIYCESATTVRISASTMGSCPASFNTGGVNAISNTFLGYQRGRPAGSCINTFSISARLYCSSGSCYVSIPYTNITVGSPGTISSPSFSNPAGTPVTTYTATAAWDNLCAPYESRAQ